MLLFFDTETTDLPNFNGRSSGKDQPNILEIAAILCDNDGTKRASMDLTIRPGDDWVLVDKI